MTKVTYDEHTWTAKPHSAGRGYLSLTRTTSRGTRAGAVIHESQVGTVDLAQWGGSIVDETYGTRQDLEVYDEVMRNCQTCSRQIEGDRPKRSPFCRRCSTERRRRQTREAVARHRAKRRLTSK